MTKDLTSGSPMRLILGFTLPTLFGLLFQQFYNLVDAMIVGTARAYSTADEEMIVVTADKALKAGMGKAGYPFISLV